MSSPIPLNSPSTAVLQAFAVSGNIQRVDGGQGESFIVDGMVLKKDKDTTVARWSAEILSTMKIDGLRIPAPIKANNGDWIFEGWSAYTFVKGKEVKGRWKEKLDVSDKLHQALVGIKKPDFIGKRTHPWEIADRMVWGSQPITYGVDLQPVMSMLEEHLQPIEVVNQVIHGDLSGNILFHEDLPPAIIDFSVYWHPAAYAKAIIVVDGVVWEHAPIEFLDSLEDSPIMNQLLLRAAMWRIKTTEEFIRQYGKGDIHAVDAYQPFINKLISRRNI